MIKTLTRFLLPIVSILGLSTIFCFMPDRLIVAGLLLIALTIILNALSFKPLEEPSASMKKEIDKYELAKSEWKKELEHDLNIQEIIEQRNRQDILQQRQKRSRPIQVRQNRIIRVIDQKESEELPYQTAKTRWRKELNDQALENRIQTVFENIRHESESGYQQGLEEIQKLLVLRFNSLKRTNSPNSKP